MRHDEWALQGKAKARFVDDHIEVGDAAGEVSVSVGEGGTAGVEYTDAGKEARQTGGQARRARRDVGKAGGRFARVTAIAGVK